MVISADFDIKSCSLVNMKFPTLIILILAVIVTLVSATSQLQSRDDIKDLKSSLTKYETCDVGYHLCSASQGGGCCQNGYTCTSGDYCIKSTGSGSGGSGRSSLGST